MFSLLSFDQNIHSVTDLHQYVDKSITIQSTCIEGTLQRKKKETKDMTCITFKRHNTQSLISSTEKKNFSICA